MVFNPLKWTERPMLFSTYLVQCNIGQPSPPSCCYLIRISRKCQYHISETVNTLWRIFVELFINLVQNRRCGKARERLLSPVSIHQLVLAVYDFSFQAYWLEFFITL